MNNDKEYHLKWEKIYEECIRKDFERKIYQECDLEDIKNEQ